MDNIDDNNNNNNNTNNDDDINFLFNLYKLKY